MIRRRLIYAVALAFVAAPCFAQAIIATGVQGGSSFGNYFVGATSLALVPVTRHAEIDVQDTFSPVESHIALGRGWSNQVTAGGILWLRRGVGIDGGATLSNYRVTGAAKVQEFSHGGVTLRTASLGIPARFTFDYLRELHNGITPGGTESAHLQGGSFGLLMRMGCVGSTCMMMQFTYQVGHVLTQGNPVCDGSCGGVITCPRAGASAGAFTGGALFAFPRPRGREDQSF